MKDPLILAILPAIILGFINGYYWSKQGYNRFQYTFLGAIMFYAILAKAIQYLMDM